MIIKRSESHYDSEARAYVPTPEGCHDLEVDDEKIIKEITIKTPDYHYVTIDGKLFKSGMKNGLESILFSTKERAEDYVKKALYWKTRIVPEIGCGVGYDTEDFYKKLIETHKVEIKKIFL